MPIIPSCERPLSNSHLTSEANQGVKDVVPALVQSVKSSGLVLVAQTEPGEREKRRGVDGVLMENAVLEFEKTIEM